VQTAKKATGNPRQEQSESKRISDLLNGIPLMSRQRESDSECVTQLFAKNRWEQTLHFYRRIESSKNILEDTIQ
jgi:hypothetical protein